MPVSRTPTQFEPIDYTQDIPQLRLKPNVKSWYERQLPYRADRVQPMTVIIDRDDYEEITSTNTNK